MIHAFILHAFSTFYFLLSNLLRSASLKMINRGIDGIVEVGARMLNAMGVVFLAAIAAPAHEQPVCASGMLWLRELCLRTRLPMQRVVLAAAILEANVFQRTNLGMIIGLTHTHQPRSARLPLAAAAKDATRAIRTVWVTRCHFG